MRHKYIVVAFILILTSVLLFSIGMVMTNRENMEYSKGCGVLKYKLDDGICYCAVEDGWLRRK